MKSTTRPSRRNGNDATTAGTAELVGPEQAAFVGPLHGAGEEHVRAVRASGASASNSSGESWLPATRDDRPALGQPQERLRARA